MKIDKVLGPTAISSRPFLSHPFFVFVFSPGGEAAPDVSFGSVSVQELAHLGIQGGGGPGEYLGEVLVDGGFGEAEVLSGGADGAAGIDHVRRQPAGPVFFVALHGTTS